MPTDQELRKRLPELLRHAAAKQLEYVFAAPIEARFEDLGYLVKMIRGEAAWLTNRQDTLRSVMAEAIGGLPQRMEVGDRANYEGCPEREMASYLYGFRQEAILAGGGWQAADVTLTYRGHYRPAALAVADLTEYPNAAKRAIARIRQDLADILIQMLKDAKREAKTSAVSDVAPTRQSSVLASESAATYIERPKYFEKMNEARNAGSKLFLLYGDGGSGKTTLAKHFADFIARGMPTVFLQSQDNMLLGAALADYLNRHAEGGVNGNMASLTRAFALGLTQGNAPAVVIIDDAQTWQTTKLLLPEDLGSLTTHVIVTSRVAIFPKGTGTVLRIGNMLDGEAAEMIRNRLSETSPDDVAMLTASLDCRPLAIEHGCALIKLRFKPAKLCEILELDPVTAIDSIDTEHKLTTIYRQITKKLEEDPDMAVTALPVLDCLLIANGSMSAAQYIWESRFTSAVVWRPLTVPQLCSDPHQELAVMSFQSGLKSLEHLSLVETREHSERFPRLEVVIHPLTLSIMQHLRSMQTWAVAFDLLRMLSAELAAAGWDKGNPLPGFGVAFCSEPVNAAVLVLERFNPEKSKAVREGIAPFLDHVREIYEGRKMHPVQTADGEVFAEGLAEFIRNLYLAGHTVEELRGW